MGNESEWGRNKSRDHKQFSGDLFVKHFSSFPMNQEKQALIPYIYNASNKDSKILQEKL